MKKLNTYIVTLEDQSTFTITGFSNADARKEAREYMIYVLGTEKWIAREEKLSVRLQKD